MKVCIAEKPSVAREIASVLGARQRCDGYWEGQGYQVTWTYGHLCGLKMPEDYDPAYKRWQMPHLPILPERFDIKLTARKQARKQFQVIKKLVKDATEVINCGDAGQEGELIQRWVLRQARNRKPVKRLWIASLTEEAIRDGFRQLRDASEFDSLYQAGQSRAIGDWLLGLNATRAYTLRFSQGKQVLSIGRVQTPTLAMLVQREKEIRNFNPETYWELHTTYREVRFKADLERFFKKEDGAQALAAVQGHPFRILSVNKKKGKERPPQLFDLTSLQVSANKRFAFSADLTLKTAQKLYEKKLITYPRVDTRYLPQDQYPKIPGILKGLRQWSEFTASLLQEPIRKSSRVFNDAKVTDHHAIIPTGKESSGLSSAEARVYEMVVRRFLAAFYPDCEVEHTQVKGQANQTVFTAKGKRILLPGWRVVEGKQEEKGKPKKASPGKEKEKEEQILPAFTKGEEGPHQPELLEKQTKAPPHYTEASLLRGMETAGKAVEDESLRDLMKANGIGRPSTRASIIETLFKRKYITRQKKKLVPTETGMRLIDTIGFDLLKSPELTGQWEHKLRQIEAGQYQAENFIREMKEMVGEVIAQVKHQAAAVRIGGEASSFSKPSQKSSGSFSKPPPKSSQKSGKGQKQASAPPVKPVSGPDRPLCPKCGKGLLIKGKKAFGCSEYKAGCDFRLPFVVWGKKLTDKQAFMLAEKGKTRKLTGFVQRGEKVKGSLRLDEEARVYLEKAENSPPAAAPPQPSQPKPITCPRCGQGHLLKGKKAYGCSRWREGCAFRLPFSEVRSKARGRKVTPALLAEMVRESEE
jgi:DNA topoisomerase-3